MRLSAPTLLIAALVGAAAIALTVASIDVPSAAAGPGLPAYADATVSARIVLAPAQIRETRDRKRWPDEMRSLLNVDHVLRYGQWEWNDRSVPAGPTHIRVDLGRQLLSVDRGGHEIGTAVILYGGQDHGTPLGRFRVLSRIADYHSRTYDAPMPHALRLTPDGVAIHGSDVRSGRATHGCIGLPLAFARLLFAAVRRGDEVLILQS